jgi:hypothetical protein
MVMINIKQAKMTLPTIRHCERSEAIQFLSTHLTRILRIENYYLSPKAFIVSDSEPLSPQAFIIKH